MITKVTVLQKMLKEVETTNGKAQKFGIKVMLDGQEKWLSTFLNKFNTDALNKIGEGQSIEVVHWTKGDFVNFRLPTQTDRLEARIEKLEKLVPGALAAAETTVEADPFDDIPF